MGSQNSRSHFFVKYYKKAMAAFMHSPAKTGVVFVYNKIMLSPTPRWLVSSSLLNCAFPLLPKGDKKDCSPAYHYGGLPGGIE